MVDSVVLPSRGEVSGAEGTNDGSQRHKPKLRYLNCITMLCFYTVLQKEDSQVLCKREREKAKIRWFVVVFITIIINLSFCLLGRHGSTSGSEEDLSPEHDQQSVKVRATLLCMVETDVVYNSRHLSRVSRVRML